jgi:lambda repressor-like predicted transcriptional regulator
MPLITVTTTSGGSIVVNDEALETLITAQNVILSSIVPLTKSAAGSHATTNNQQDNIISCLHNVNTTLAAMAVQNSSALSSIQSTLEQLVITNQLIAADQIRNHLFQQQTVNTTRGDAGLTPIAPSAGDVTQQISTGIKDASNMSLQVGASAMLETMVQNAGTRALEIAKDYLTDNTTMIGTFGSFVAGQFKVVFGPIDTANSATLTAKNALDNALGVTSAQSTKSP